MVCMDGVPGGKEICLMREVTTAAFAAVGSDEVESVGIEGSPVPPLPQIAAQKS